MRKLLFTIALSCLTIGAVAQKAKGDFSIKPLVGVNITGFSESVLEDYYHPRIGLTAGLEAEYGVNDWLGLSLGLAYSQMGSKADGTLAGYTFTENSSIYLEADNKGKVSADYLSLPLLANFHIPSLKGLSLKVGVQFGLLTSSKLKYDSSFRVEAWDKEQNTLLEGFPTFGEESISQTDICKSADFGIPFGISYERNNIVIDARYYLGLTKIDKTEEPESIRNRCLSITIGYRLHL